MNRQALSRGRTREGGKLSCVRVSTIVREYVFLAFSLLAPSLNEEIQSSPLRRRRKSTCARKCAWTQASRRRAARGYRAHRCVSRARSSRFFRRLLRFFILAPFWMPLAEDRRVARCAKREHDVFRLCAWTQACLSFAAIRGFYTREVIIPYRMVAFFAAVYLFSPRELA